MCQRVTLDEISTFEHVSMLKVILDCLNKVYCYLESIEPLIFTQLDLFEVIADLQISQF